MKLKEIHRTSTFAWSPSQSVPLIATGTVAGALDESFSNDSQLEIWAPDFLDKNEYALGGDAGQPAPRASVTTSSRFNRLAWGYVDSAKPRGVLAAGMESGELGLWDPVKILDGADASESLVFRNTTHTGPVRALDFNPLQSNLLASGASSAEIYIWDLKDPSKPYSPGTRSNKLDEATAVSWNNHVAHILATSSSSGYTVVWDLRAKREMVALAYSGGAGTTGGSAHGGALAVGSRRGMSAVAWHPDNATRLVTASEDDTSPIIMSWDLRNARAPEKILTGHEKGVLSLSWCRQDSDLLLSCGKDNRVLCWNPQRAEIIGELPPANNWAFEVEWCPKNPDLFATAFFDGTIGVHSLQTTNDAAIQPETTQANGADIFDQLGQIGQANLQLKQPPKWLRRPASVSFGYGGKLVTAGNLPGAQGQHQSGFVHLRTVVTEESIIDRAKKLQEAVDKQSLGEFAEEKVKQTEGKGKAEESESWKALLSLFRSNSREELINLFGLNKETIAAQVAEAVKKVKQAAPAAPEEEDTQGTPHEPVVSFVEPEKEEEQPAETPRDREGAESPPQSAGPVASEATPSEFSTSATSDGTKATELESTTTEHSLFNDEIMGTPQTEAAADFFSSMGTLRGSSAIPAHMQVPHTNYGQDSSVAATVGSGPPSVASEQLKSNTFAIYPTETSETDKLLTKALVLGDFESAVSLCIASDRFADAILLAVKGGQELLAKTQKAYFERQTTTLPYLRLFQSIVTDDLEDIVQNADLRDWQEIFVVICTFAKNEQFSALVEQLGQRLEFQGNVVKASNAEDAPEKVHEFKKNATLCYLAAKKLEKIVNIWVDEMREDENAMQQHVDQLPADASRYTVHAQALQTFIEKVTVFRAATLYVDNDLKQKPADADAKTYKLATLYDRYYEYADLLASQGLVNEAVKYLELAPGDYKGSQGSEVEFDVARERLLAAAGAAATPKLSRAQPLASTSTSTAYGTTSYGGTSYGGTTYATTGYTAPAQPSVNPAVGTTASPYAPYNPPAPVASAPSTNPYAPPPTNNAAPPVTTPYAPPSGTSPYAPPAPYGGQPAATNSPYNRPAGNTFAPPPGPGAMRPPPPPSAPPKRDQGGWNDAPVLSRGGTPGNAGGAGSKPPPLTAPFPGAQTPGTPISPSPYMQTQQQPLPPPPRAGTSTPSRGMGGPPAPPPMGPPRGASMGAPTNWGPGGQFVGGPAPPPPQQYGAPPTRALSPGVRPPPGPGAPGQFTAHPHAPPPPGPGRVLSPPQGPPRTLSGPNYAPPPGARNTPPPGVQNTPPPPGPYAPPPNAGAAPPSGPYAPPPNGGAPGAPPPSGPYAPPPGGVARPGPPGAGAPVARPPPGPGAGAPPAGPPQGPPQGQGQPRPPAPPAKAAPPPPKYPPGDRSHIPDSLKPAFEVLSGEMGKLKATTPPNQKRLVDDTERRLNLLFDALNCETLSKNTAEILLALIRAMAERNRDAALMIHADMLKAATTANEDITMWAMGVKQLCLRV